MFNGHNLGVSPNSIFWISELISSQYDSMKTVVISRAGGAFQLYKTNLYKAFPNTVQFIDDSTGFLLAGPASYTPVNYLLKTSNGGQSWNPVFTSSNDSIMEFHALPSGTIYILQHSGTVSKGISWGSSWSTQTPVPSGSHNSIHFMTDSTGYAAGDLGRLYKTIDFANTWTMESDTTTCSINRIYTFGNVAYYVDARLNVYKNGPLVAGLNELKLQMPVKVYPNPASDEIIVNIPFNCCAKGVIQIYNATGMLVLTLPYTQNQTSVNLTDLPQGMYLVRVVDEKGIGSTQIIKR